MYIGCVKVLLLHSARDIDVPDSKFCKLVLIKNPLLVASGAEAGQLMVGSRACLLCKRHFPSPGELQAVPVSALLYQQVTSCSLQGHRDSGADRSHTDTVVLITECSNTAASRDLNRVCAGENESETMKKTTLMAGN